MTFLKKQTHLGDFFSPNGRMRPLPFVVLGISILVLWQLPPPVLTVLLLYRVSVQATTFTIVTVVLACLAWPLACFAAKRLHDVGLSGWLGVVYLAHLASVLFTVVSNWIAPIYVIPLIHDSILWLLVATTAVLAMLPSSNGENKYGADPREGSLKASKLF